MKTPQTLLVINLGSSSLKFAIFRRRTVLLHGQIEHFGPAALATLRSGGQSSMRTLHIAGAVGAMRAMKRIIDHVRLRPTVIAHRIVHGGTKFVRPTQLTAAVLKDLRQLAPLAPLHLPLNLTGVQRAAGFWPNAPEWGVFDTAAFSGLPLVAKSYALPLELTEKYHIHKYGFHGISHHWALHQAAKELGVPVGRLSAVTIHLGAGSSMALWRSGRPVETTMGFTPLEGLAMSTRSGDIDPAIPLFLQEQAGMSARQVGKLLEQQSGLFGLTGLRDMRDILGAAGHPVAGWPAKRWTAAEIDHARLALDIYLHDIQKYLSMYLGLLPTVRAIVFTGSIGQNSWIQQRVIGGVPAATGRRRLSILADEEQAIADQLQPMIH